MPIDRSELSSINGLIEQVSDRITAMGETALANHDDSVATELFAIERALSGAKRRLTRLLGDR